MSCGRKTVTSETFQAAARAGYEKPLHTDPAAPTEPQNFQENPLLMQHAKLTDIAERQYERVNMKAHQIRVPPCLWVTTNISAGWHLTWGLQFTLLLWRTGRTQRCPKPDSQPGDNVQRETEAYFLLLSLPCWLCTEGTKTKQGCLNALSQQQS